MSAAFSALAWVFAAGTCVSAALAAITVPLALRHQRQRRNESFGIVSVREGRVTISRTWTVGDQVAAPELRAKALTLARIQRQRLAKQDRPEQPQSQTLEGPSNAQDAIQAELDQLRGGAEIDKGLETWERREKPGEEPSPG